MNNTYVDLMDLLKTSPQPQPKAAPKPAKPAGVALAGQKGVWLR
jgi:hypothetical protein